MRERRPKIELFFNKTDWFQMDNLVLPKGAILGIDDNNEKFIMWNKVILHEENGNMGLLIYRKDGHGGWIRTQENDTYLVHFIINKYGNEECTSLSGLKIYHQKKTIDKIQYDHEREIKNLMRHTSFKKKGSCGRPTGGWTQDINYRGYTDESHWAGKVGSMCASRRDF